MVRAYVLIKASTGDADRVRRDVTDCAGVEAAHIVAGDVDLIATVTVDDPTEIKDIVAGEIQSIPGVADTKTYIAMD